MKLTFVLALTAALSASAAETHAAQNETLRGEVVEVHACELYTGGCTASAQYSSGGRSLLRIWKFTDGSEAGVSLKGLEFGALEVADENLAKAETRPQQTVFYLPANASAEAQRALVAWAKRECPEIGNSTVTEKIEKLEYERSGGVIHVQVGENISLQTRPMEHCDAGSCGESLWYSPKSNVSRFTVLVDEQCTVTEPAVSLSRREHGIRSVFFAEFGGASAPSASFSMAMLN